MWKGSDYPKSRAAVPSPGQLAGFSSSCWWRRQAGSTVKESGRVPPLGGTPWVPTAPGPECGTSLLHLPDIPALEFLQRGVSSLLLQSHVRFLAKHPLLSPLLPTSQSPWVIPWIRYLFEVMCRFHACHGTYLTALPVSDADIEQERALLTKKQV